MISLQAKKHDNFSVEFKFGFTAEDAKKNNDFAVNTWIFVPNSMSISSQNYGKEQFYRDVKSNLRLITPVYSLRELSLDTSVPFVCLKDSLTKLAGGENCEDQFESHLKMFAAIFKSALRNSTNSLQKVQDVSALEPMCGECCNILNSILKNFRSLYPLVEKISPEEKQHFRKVDEFLSNKMRVKAILMVKDIDLKESPDWSGIRSILVDFVLREKRYAEANGFDELNNDPVHNRKMLYNQGILKKYIDSDLYINLDKRKDGRAVEQLYYSVAAGVAMMFATAVGWITQAKYGSHITGTLFIVVVVSYMLKDRIKALMRIWFAHKLVNRYYDKTAEVTVNDRKVGKIKEAVDFVPGFKIPEKVMEIREQNASIEDESRIFDEKVLLYRKHLELNGNILAESEYPLRGVHEIVRLHMDRYVLKMDNPEMPVNLMDDNGNISVMSVQRTYRLHIVFQLSHQNQVEYHYMRIAMNRNGILHIEEI